MGKVLLNSEDIKEQKEELYEMQKLRLKIYGKYITMIRDAVAKAFLPSNQIKLVEIKLLKLHTTITTIIKQILKTPNKMYTLQPYYTKQTNLR